MKRGAEVTTPSSTMAKALHGDCPPIEQSGSADRVVDAVARALAPSESNPSDTTQVTPLVGSCAFALVTLVPLMKAGCSTYLAVPSLEQVPSH